MRLEFHPAAAEEFTAATGAYEEIRAGLGGRFLDAVRATCARILVQPEAGSPRTAGVRRRPVPGFPYDVVYRRAGEALQVLALAHYRRRPDRWTDRVRG